MFMLNSKSILDCYEEEEHEQHNQEITDILERLLDLPDYDCAVLMKYQDIAHRDIPMKVLPTTLHDCQEVIEWGDFKNGVDLLVDEGYLVFLVHGQGYTYTIDGSSHLVTTAFKILPYDEDKDFLDVVDYLLGVGQVHTAEQQFETIHNMYS